MTDTTVIPFFILHRLDLLKRSIAITFRFMPFTAQSKEIGSSLGEKQINYFVLLATYTIFVG